MHVMVTGARHPQHGIPDSYPPHYMHAMTTGARHPQHVSFLLILILCSPWSQVHAIISMGKHANDADAKAMLVQV